MQVKQKTPDAHPLIIDEAHYASALDAIRKIVDDEGIAGLYSGINGSLIGVASTNFAYFYWYSVVRTLYLSSQKITKPPNTATELSLGAVAGAVAQVFTIPVSVITTRQQTQPKGDKKGLMDTGREVVLSEDGWTGLWRGLKASLVLVVNPAITYGAYQRLRELFFPGKTNLRPWESFCAQPLPFQEYQPADVSLSSWCGFQGTCDNSHTTVDCCQGWTTIAATIRKKWKAVQKLH